VGGGGGVRHVTCTSGTYAPDPPFLHGGVGEYDADVLGQYHEKRSLWLT
jgi:hypothetical protein